MYEGRLEDDFNAWVSREGCTVKGFQIKHAMDEECWIAVIEHKNPDVLCESADLIIEFLNVGRQQGYISRYWFEDIYDEHLYKVGRKLAFCYNA